MAVGVEGNFGKEARDSTGHRQENEKQHRTTEGIFDEMTGVHQDIDPQLFLLSVDSISGAEIVAMAKTLNAQIFQTAALIADAFECVPLESTTDSGRSYLGFGEIMTRLLASADPAAVQLALQAAISRWCKEKTETWCLGDEVFGWCLLGLYEKIWHAENQVTAGRWRAITRAKTKHSDEVNLLNTSLIECVFEVMFAAGWKTERGEAIASIHGRFGGQISAIVKHALQLRKAIWEDMISEELEVTYIEPNCRFDGRVMEDADAAGSRATRNKQEAVACTSDIGVQRRNRGGNLEGGGILLRPKVVLESALQEI
ncbi:hypothetical protein DFH07DRAFT_754394 [Mycena maculata]|uniref:Uncharacterized protein n=1 Tax=Mycena maculata TaxID=230809 RepID=A0AAD7I579_9AGAR|nr:hypothetical protein DFH07DRAFT_754394 [Mycena maculata]